MAYKKWGYENKRRIGEEYDARRRYTEEEKNNIRELSLLGMDPYDIRRETGASMFTIAVLADPKKAEARDLVRKPWTAYYTTEKGREWKANYRARMKKLKEIRDKKKNESTTS